MPQVLQRSLHPCNPQSKPVTSRSGAGGCGLSCRCQPSISSTACAPSGVRRECDAAQLTGGGTVQVETGCSTPRGPNPTASCNSSLANEGTDLLYSQCDPCAWYLSVSARYLAPVFGQMTVKHFIVCGLSLAWRGKISVLSLYTCDCMTRVPGA